jgi:hypothetical protein
MKQKSKIHITAGELLNEYLRKNDKGLFIPFNEDLSTGDLSYPLLDETFINIRSRSLNVSREVYISKLDAVLSFMKNIGQYEEVVLWFGDEPFCQVNLLGVLTLLEQVKYEGNVVINIVDEFHDNAIIRTHTNLNLGGFIEIYRAFINQHHLRETYSLL